VTKITTIGLDLAKNVFQAHAAAADGSTIFSRKLRRSEVLEFFQKTPPCLVGLEACGGAHHWARQIRALGHEVRMMPPAYVKPFVKRGKTDAGDAEAISEAVGRKTMRFVPIKPAEQQADAVVLKTRALLVGQQTQAINALRAHLAEFGIIAGAGKSKVAPLIAIVDDEADTRLPSAARFALHHLAREIERLTDQIKTLEKAIVVATRRDDTARRLTTIPGIGAITAATILALVPDPAGFRSSRHFAARLGLTPKPHSSGRAAGVHLKDGQSHLTVSARRRRNIRPALCAQQPERLAMDHRVAGAAPLQGRRRGSGQQNGSHRLGLARQRRLVPSGQYR
jgi:transposase